MISIEYFMIGVAIMLIIVLNIIFFYLSSEEASNNEYEYKNKIDYNSYKNSGGIK